MHQKLFKLREKWFVLLPWGPLIQDNGVEPAIVGDGLHLSSLCPVVAVVLSVKLQIAPKPEGFTQHL